MKKKKIIVSCIITILIICLGGITYKYYSKNQVIKDFKKYIENYDESIKCFNLTTEEKDKYNELKTKADVAINLKSDDYIKSLEGDFENLKKNIEKENIENINNQYKKIKDIDINNFNHDTKENLKDLKKKIQDKINSKDFIQAKKYIDEANDIVNKVNKEKDDNEKKKAAKESEDKKAREQGKKEEKNKMNPKDISGTYEYEELNRYGVPVVWDGIKIEKIGENRISFEGGYNFLLSCYYNGESINAKDITKEIENNGATHSRSGSRSGVLEYKGNNIWEGKVYDDNNSVTEDKGTLDNPKIPAKISIDGDKLILTFEDKVVPYSKK